MTTPHTQYTREELHQTNTFQTVRRPGTAAEWIAGADFNIFTVTGVVVVSHCFGVCTTLIAGAIVPFLEITTVVPAATVPLCTLAVSLDTDVAGTIYGWSGLIAGVLTPSAVGAMELAAGNTWAGGLIVLTAGVINVDNAIASTAGVIDWYITYLPMTTDGEITIL